MKLKATKRYVDKHSRKIVEVDTVFEEKDPRGKELITEGVAQEIKGTEAESKKKAATTQEG